MNVPTRPVSAALVVLVGCAAAEVTPVPRAGQPRPAVEIAQPTDRATLEKGLAVCEDLATGPWTAAGEACKEACLVASQDSQVLATCVHFIAQDVEITQDARRGGATISGTLVCRRPAGLQRITVVATTDPLRFGPVRELGRFELDLDRVDPVPLFEDLRLPFALSLGDALGLARDANGHHRLSLLGIASSEDGPVVAGFLRVSF